VRHTNFRATDSSFKVIGLDDSTIQVWTFTLTDGLIAQDDVTPSAIGDYYSGTVATSGTDCFMLTLQGGVSGILRIGDPEVLVIGFTGETGQDNTYKQLDLDGAELSSGSMTEIGEGFYYAEPSSLDPSYFDINGGLIKTLVVPYMVVESDSGGGITADGIFNNTGFNQFGFLGERHSYFDLDQGKWINDDGVDAKAADLAKAVCVKYSLVWDDKDDEQWIGNYIKYIRSYTENDGKVRYYKPYKTPDGNDANFTLMQTDEAGNLVVKGIDMLLLQTLETINDTDGTLVPFKEV